VVRSLVPLPSQFKILLVCLLLSFKDIQFFVKVFLHVLGILLFIVSHHFDIVLEHAFDVDVRLAFCNLGPYFDTTLSVLVDGGQGWSVALANVLVMGYGFEIAEAMSGLL
jgi:hypothetical protein